MKKVVCLMIALTVAALCFAEDDKPYTFAGIPWGTTQEDVIKFVIERTKFKKTHIDAKNRLNSIVPEIHEWQDTLAYKDESKGFTIVFCFLGKELVDVEMFKALSIFFSTPELTKQESEEFQQSVNMLIKKYGEPMYLKPAEGKIHHKITTVQVRDIYKTPFNGMLYGMKMVWKKNNSYIIIAKTDFSWHIIYTRREAVFNYFCEKIEPYPYATNKEKQSLDDMF